MECYPSGVAPGFQDWGSKIFPSFPSDVVLEARPWPRGSSRTKFCVLGLGLGLGLGLDGPVLGLGLGLEARPWT